MIPVAPQPEPPSFDVLVRQKGTQFLSQSGIPSKASAFRNYWRYVAQDLYGAYAGICAYTCMCVVGPGTVDHFLPKTRFPLLAYEWLNYRLSSAIANQRKGENLGLLDPFSIQDEWFGMDFPSCFVVLGGSVPVGKIADVQKTIDILKLNEDDNFVQDRCNAIMLFVEGNVTFNFLRVRYPFVAFELHRQGLKSNPGSVFKRRT